MSGRERETHTHTHTHPRASFKSHEYNIIPLVEIGNHVRTWNLAAHIWLAGRDDKELCSQKHSEISFFIATVPLGE